MPRKAACMIAALVAAFVFSRPAMALDCKASEGRTDKAICTDPRLLAAETKMLAALAALREATEAERRAMIDENQKRWQSGRSGGCDGAEDAAACALEKTEARIVYLTATPAAGPGIDPSLVPTISVVEPAGERCGANLALYRFADSAALANVALSVRLTQLFVAYQDNLGPNDPDATCSYSVSAEIAFASPGVVNIALNWEHYPAGGYSDSGWHAFFIEPASGRLLTFADLFPDSARASLVAACTADLHAQKLARAVRTAHAADDPEQVAALTAEVDADLATRNQTIAAHVGDLLYWRITVEGVRVDFARFDVSSVMEGGYDCAIPKAVLQATAAPAAWVAP